MSRALPLTDPSDVRGGADRRCPQTGPLDAFRLRGRRRHVRRAEERVGAYFTDRWGAPTLAIIVAVLLLCLVDGVLTIELLGLGGEEINPVMRALIERGPWPFLVVKYLITAAGLPFLVVYGNWPLFGTRVRTRYLLPIFLVLYLALLAYQLHLLGQC